MICKICNSNSRLAFNAKVLNKYDVNYFKCNNCGLLFSEEPYWLDEAYKQAINISDTGLLDRNTYFSKVLSVLIYFNFNRTAKYLDYAGGYGIFTRLMRDIGFDFYWQDPYTQNLLANGFENDIEAISKYEVLTAFEVFEHLVNPLEEIKKMLQLSGTIIFSTELMPSEIPDPKSWWYYGFDHGQHVSFYSRKTIDYLAKNFKLNYYFLNNVHMISAKTFNTSILSLEKKLSTRGLFLFIKKLMKSKTYTDHLLLKDSENK